MKEIGLKMEKLHSLFLHDDIMQYYNGYLQVRFENETIFKMGHGYADYTKKVTADEDTIYLLGSLTKLFTGISIALLENDGIVRKSDRLNRYFPDYQNAKDVTIEHLLTHTSGIPDYWRQVGISSIDYTDAADIFQFIKRFDCMHNPGIVHQYCNSNYLILGLLIECVTGLSYREFLHKYLFKPLNMNRTGVIPAHNCMDNVAVGYMRLFPDVKQAAKPEQTVIFGNMTGAGNIFSCASDLAKFDAALNNNRLFSQERKEKLWQDNDVHYNYGWMIKEGIVSHGGDIVGFSTNYAKYLEKKITVIALNNVDGKQERNMWHYMKRISECVGL